MKVLLDMNLQHRWVGYLANFGISAQHWASIGQADAPDSEILEFARKQGFLILTQDLDFGILLAVTRAASPSVIQLRNKDVRPEAIGGAVVMALENLKEELAKGALLTAQPGKIRLTSLPLC